MSLLSSVLGVSIKACKMAVTAPNTVAKVATNINKARLLSKIPAINDTESFLLKKAGEGSKNIAQKFIKSEFFKKSVELVDEYNEHRKMCEKKRNNKTMEE